MDFAIATISTKGQFVIPKHMREGIAEGDEFLVVRDEGRFILKRMGDVAKELKDDIRFGEEVTKAWEEVDRGEFETVTKEEFIKRMKTW